MDASHMARVALARLPRPYTDEVTLHVFCEIERTPHLRLQYDQLADTMGKGPLNRQIGRVVRKTLKAAAIGKIVAPDVCEIVTGPSRLVGIDSDWTWD